LIRTTRFFLDLTYVFSQVKIKQIKKKKKRHTKRQAQWALSPGSTKREFQFQRLISSAHCRQREYQPTSTSSFRAKHHSSPHATRRKTTSNSLRRENRRAKACGHKNRCEQCRGERERSQPRKWTPWAHTHSLT